MCKEVDALIESKSKNSDAAVLGKGNGGDKMSISVKELLAAAQTDLINFLPKNQLNFGPQPPKRLAAARYDKSRYNTHQQKF